MDIGIWMAWEVLDHKRHNDHAVQVWNLRHLPDGFVQGVGAGRLFVAVDGHWRGFFRLRRRIMRNEADWACPYTLSFDPQSWTAIPPQSAPSRNRRTGYTLDLPPVEMFHPTPLLHPNQTETTRRNNEIEEFCALLQREEDRE